MKKLLALAVTAALSTSAVAGTGVFGDVSQYNKKSSDISVAGAHNTDKETGLQANYRMENGFFIGAETAYDWKTDTKGILASSIGAGFRYNINDNFYIMPQIIYTKQDRDSYFSEWAIEEDDLDFTTEKYKVGNAWEFALQTAYHMDNGFFVAGRYGYAKSKDMFTMQHFDQFAGSEPELTQTIKLDDKIPTHTFDLTAGYEIAEVAVFTATWTHVRTADKLSMSVVDGIDPDFGNDSAATLKVRGKTNEYKLKAAYLGMGNVIPFVSYTVKGDYKFTGDAKPLNAHELIGKADNVLEVGVNVSF